MVGSEKDRQFIENSEFCVECGCERELNKFGVCEQCWENSPAGNYESWEETLN